MIASLGSCSCERLALNRAKADAKKQITKDSPDLLVAVPFNNIKIDAKGGSTDEIELKEGSITVPIPLQSKKSQNGVGLDYKGFSVSVMFAAGGHDFDSLPISWGKDDLEKLRSICTASGKAIEAARTIQEVKATVALLTARGTISPPGAFDQVDWVEHDNFTGLLTGNFANFPWMSLAYHPHEGEGKVYVMNFKQLDGGRREDVLQFLARIAYKPKTK